MLLVDDDAVLVSVRTGEGETAIWSADTAMADVLVQTIHAGVRSMVGDGDPSADDDAPPDGGSRDDATGRD
jgi:hypothetical protein